MISLFSRSSEFSNYHLDVDESGLHESPHSLFVEARKPGTL